MITRGATSWSTFDTRVGAEDDDDGNDKGNARADDSDGSCESVVAHSTVVPDR